MLRIIDNGAPFDCTYVKKNGDLAEFKGLRKPEREEKAPVQAERARNQPPADRRRRRTGNSYESLVPFVTANDEVRELYTRLIVIFNGEETVL